MSLRILKSTCFSVKIKMIRNFTTRAKRLLQHLRETYEFENYSVL